MAFFQKLFAGEPAPDQKTVLRNWTRELNRKIREVERDMENVKREENKIIAELKKGAKANMPKGALRALAATVVRGRNTRNRLHATATQIRSVTYELEHMAAQIRVAKILGTSTNLMKAMRAMMPIQAVRKTCMEMSKEMFKAGLVEEALDETFAVMDNEDLETEADAEVDKVLGDLLQGMMASGELKQREEKEKEVVEDTTAEDEMIARLTNL